MGAEFGCKDLNDGGRWGWGGLEWTDLTFLGPEARDADRTRLATWSILQSCYLHAKQNTCEPSFSRAVLLDIVQNCGGVFFSYFLNALFSCCLTNS